MYNTIFISERVMYSPFCEDAVYQELRQLPNDAGYHVEALLLPDLEVGDDGQGDLYFVYLEEKGG